MPQFYTTDFYMEVAKGNIPGHSLVAKFGEVLELPNTGVFEDVWDAGGGYVPPTQARIHNVASTGASAALDTGTVLSSGNATGGSLTTLVDLTASFSTDTVAVGDAVLNDANVEIAAVTAVTSETTLTFLGSMRSPSSGLFGNAFKAGDAYRIVTNASTGASIFHIGLSLDASFLDQEEFVVLNGASNVATVGSYIRQSRARVFGPGTTGAAGDITSTAVDDGTVSMQILGSNNQTLMAIFTVPANKIGYIVKWWGSMTRAVASATSDFHLRGGTLDGIGYLLQDRSFTTTGSSQFTYDYTVPIPIPGGSDIWVEANSNANLVGVASGFDVILVDAGA